MSPAFLSSTFALPKAHPTEACADSRAEVFEGMALVSNGIQKRSPRRTGVRRGPEAPLADRFCRETRAAGISLVKLRLCQV